MKRTKLLNTYREILEAAYLLVLILLVYNCSTSISINSFTTAVQAQKKNNFMVSQGPKAPLVGCAFYCALFTHF